MKFSIYATDNAIQVNLEPENEYEIRHLELLKSYTGRVTIFNDRININETQGGWLRNFGDEPKSTNKLAIKIEKENDK